VHRLGLLQIKGVHAAQLLVQEAGQLVRGHHCASSAALIGKLPIV
jgi:hypothetical protein